MESYQTDCRVGKMHVGEILERMGIIDGGWSVTFRCLRPSRDAIIIDKLATPLALRCWSSVRFCLMFWSQAFIERFHDRSDRETRAWHCLFGGVLHPLDVVSSQKWITVWTKRG